MQGWQLPGGAWFLVCFPHHLQIHRAKAALLYFAMQRTRLCFVALCFCTILLLLWATAKQYTRLWLTRAIGILMFSYNVFLKSLHTWQRWGHIMVLIATLNFGIHEEDSQWYAFSIRLHATTFASSSGLHPTPLWRPCKPLYFCPQFRTLASALLHSTCGFSLMVNASLLQFNACLRCTFL